MLLFRTIIMLVACYAAAPLWLGALGQSQPSLTSFSGIVVDFRGGSIGGAHVSLAPQRGSKLVETTTDSSGHFQFSDLESGEYSLVIGANGFQTLTKPVVVSQNANQDTTYTLQISFAQTSVDVVVTASRLAQPIEDVPASVSIVTREQIEQTPARTIDDVLRRVPSVDLPLASTNEQHPTDTIVSMRGLSGIRSLVLLDGVPINDPFFGFIQWSEAPVEAIDRVEVVRGGGATLWGNNAMGGVINILTKPINKTELVVDAAGGSRGTYRSNVHAALAGKRYGLGIDAGTSHSDGYIEQVKDSRGPITVPTSFSADTVALFGDVNLGHNLRASTRISHYDNAQNFLTRLQTNGEGAWRYTGALHWNPKDTDSLDLNVFHSDERFTTSNTGTPDGFDPTQAEYVQNSHRTLVSNLGASLMWTHMFSGVLRSVSAGGDYQGIRGSDAAAIYDQSNTYLRTDLGSGNQRFAGGFMQADLRPMERLQMLFSIRYQDFYSYNGLDNSPGGLGTSVPARHDGDVDPRFSVRYQLPHGFALRGAVYRAFRAPTLDNLYRAASVPGYILYGNASLAPETLNGGEVGFDFNKGPVRFQATAYDSRISKLITYRNLSANTLPPGFDQGARLINAGSARSRGFEAELNWRIAPTFSTVLGYTYADSVVTSNPEDPASLGVQQPGIPKNRVSAGVNWTAFHGIKVSPHLRYLSRTSGDPDAVYQTDVHLVADLAITAPLKKGLDGFVQIENLLDRRYIGTNDGFTAPLYGRPFTAIVGIRLKLHWP